MRRVYRLRLYQGAEVVEEALCAPSARVPLPVIVAALRELGPPGTRVEVVELDPATGQPKPVAAIARALAELLGDLA